MVIFDYDKANLGSVQCSAWCSDEGHSYRDFEECRKEDNLKGLLSLKIVPIVFS